MKLIILENKLVKDFLCFCYWLIDLTYLCVLRGLLLLFICLFVSIGQL